MIHSLQAISSPQIFFLSVWLCSCISFGLERQLIATVNPGCSHCLRTDFDIIHVRADGPNDTLHHLWGFDRKPAVVVALTSLETNLSIHWDEQSKPVKVVFTNPPYYSYGVLLNKIFEFNDADDVGFLNMSNTNQSYINKIEMPDVWKMGQLIQNRDSVHLTVSGTWSHNASVTGGSIEVQLDAFKMEDHSPFIPHLLHSPNASQIDFGILNLATKSGFQQSRYALELVIAANESLQSSVIPHFSKSLDDEHTPGIFTLVDVQTSASVESGSGGYIQWRPVAYIATERDIVNSTETAVYDVKNVTNSSFNCMGTLLEMYFGMITLEQNLFKAVNVSFGAKNDGFYAKTNMTFWTATIGYGYPPEEKFTLLLILTIVIGLGVPTLVILLSFIYLALRRISYRKDDLFLSR